MWRQWFIPIAVLALAVLVWLFRRRRHMHAWGQEVQIARARELFTLQHERLETIFIKAANATGKPRGLRWVNCAFEKELLLARERHSKQLVGMVPVTIQFEAIEGGDMEGVAAVGNLRNATALFAFVSGQWQTAGKAVFNLNPPEVLHRFEKEYEQAENALATIHMKSNEAARNGESAN